MDDEEIIGLAALIFGGLVLFALARSRSSSAALSPFGTTGTVGTPSAGGTAGGGTAGVSTAGGTGTGTGTGTVAPSTGTGTAPQFTGAAPGSILPGSPLLRGIQTILPLTVSAAGVAFIKAREGFNSRVKTDAGHPEIGFGHDIVANDPALRSAGVNQAAILAGSAISMAQGSAILAFDNQQEAAVINAYVTVPLTQNQFDALADFIHNEGETHFRTSTLLQKLNAGDYAGASAEFARWDYSQGHVLADLQQRRALEQNLFNQNTGTAGGTQMAGGTGTGTGTGTA